VIAANLPVVPEVSSVQFTCRFGIGHYARTAPLRVLRPNAHHAVCGIDISGF
jgi:hypothetical protein